MFLGKTADFRCGTEKVGEPGTACGSRKQRIAQWLMGSCQRDTGGSLQEIQRSKKKNKDKGDIDRYRNKDIDIDIKFKPFILTQVNIQM